MCAFHAHIIPVRKHSASYRLCSFPPRPEGRGFSELLMKKLISLPNGAFVDGTRVIEISNVYRDGEDFIQSP